MCVKTGGTKVILVKVIVKASTMTDRRHRLSLAGNGLITSAIKLAINLTIKLKTYKLLQLQRAAFCCSYYNKMLLVVAAIICKLFASFIVSFIASFIALVISP